MELDNYNFNSVMIHSFTIDGEVINKNYIINELKRRKILKLSGQKLADLQNSKSADGATHKQFDPFIWLNREYGKSEHTGEPFQRNYLWLMRYLTLVVQMTYSNRTQPIWFFKNINSENLEKYVSNKHGLLTEIQSILNEARILKFNESYSVGVGGHTKSVSLHPRFKKAKVSYISLPDLDCSFMADKRWRKDNQKLIEDDEKTSTHIIHNLSRLRLDDLRDVHSTMYSYFDYLDNHPDKDGLTDFGKNKYHSQLAAINEFAGTCDLDGNKITEAQRKKSQQNYFRYHAHTGRVYSQFTSFPKIFRRHLSYKGARLSVVDIRSAHPWLLLNWYLRAKAHPTNIQREKDKYRKWFTDRQDRDSFYERLANHPLCKLNQPKKGQESRKTYRDYVKGRYFTFLYDEPHDEFDCGITSVYQKEFPILTKTLNDAKSSFDTKQRGAILDYVENTMARENKKIAKENQQLEADDKPLKPLKVIEDYAHVKVALENSQFEGNVMIGKVCPELADEGIWHFPIHDAIACQTRRVRDVKRVMKKHWKDAIGFEPHLSVTDYAKVSDFWR